MTQSTQRNTGRNTKMCPERRPMRARNWAFTFNNHTKENIDTLTHLFSHDSKVIKWRFQEEKSKSGTLHLQGTIAFKNAISINSLKLINKKIHWEICRNLAASLNYCKKFDSRHGNIYQSNNLKDEYKETRSIEDITHIGQIYDDMRDQMIKANKEALQRLKDEWSGLVEKKNT